VSADTSTLPPEVKPRLGQSWLSFGIKLLDEVGTTVLLTLQTLAWAARRPFRFAQFVQAMEFIGVHSVFIVALTGTFSGMVLALQMVHSFKQFQAEGLVGGVVALSLTREISPVFTGLMVTARAGSAWAAELGNMRVTEQIDALTTMAVSPVQYLLTPRLVAAVVMVPLLCVLYTCVGMAGAWLVAVEWLHVDPGIFIARAKQYAFPKDFFMGEIKACVFGFLISSISCRQGFFASGGARGVGLATTRAVVQSAVAILVANYLLTAWLTGD
jgi:phospholipid/cholesterol/gamma-HCH transport system permease protein